MGSQNNYDVVELARPGNRWKIETPETYPELGGGGGIDRIHVLACPWGLAKKHVTITPPKALCLFLDVPPTGPNSTNTGQS